MHSSFYDVKRTQSLSALCGLTEWPAHLLYMNLHTIRTCATSLSSVNLCVLGMWAFEQQRERPEDVHPLGIFFFFSLIDTVATSAFV